MFSERVFAYCDDKGRDVTELRLAVILQHMIPAESAGVVFTVDPVRGVDDAVLIEACPGLGDELVSGQVDPDRYLFDWRRGLELERHCESELIPVLSVAEVAEIARCCVSVQARFGRPVDLEWARAEGKFWLVQTRPVTSISQNGWPGEWTTADFKDGGVSAGVCTPFMASLYEKVFAHSLPTYLDEVGLTAPKPETQDWYGVFYGRPYWNAGLVKARLEGLPGYCERSFDEDLGIKPQYEGQGKMTGLTPFSIVRGLLVLGKLKKSFAGRLSEIETIARGLQSRMDNWETLDPQAQSEEDLVAHLRRLLNKDYIQCESDYFRTIYDNSNAQTLFQDNFPKWSQAKGEPAIDSLAFLGGLENVSHLRPVHEEAEVVAQMRSIPGLADSYCALSVDALQKNYLAGEDYPGKKWIGPFLQRWWWMAPRTLEILEPRWGEDPSPVFASIKRGLLASLKQKNDLKQSEEKQRAHFESADKEIRARIAKHFLLTRTMTLNSYQLSLMTVRQLLWWREEMRMHSTRMYALLRRWALEFGVRCKRKALLTSETDVFFLDFKELNLLLDGEIQADELKAKLCQAHLYYDSFRDFVNPNEIGSRWSGLPADSDLISTGALKGIAGSGGLYVGPAKVIASVEEVGRLEPGDVLVTRFTDPGWTTSFSGLGAVVTETGGVLSHAAVISREYGFPAVLAVSGATTAFQDGDLVEVNGTAGTVQVLESEG
jgi:pyruvate,water dikinase